MTQEAEAKLIQKIINEAKSEANAIIDAATEKANLKVEDAKKHAAEKKEKANKDAKKKVVAKTEQAKLAHEVTNIKSIIQQKQEAMSAVFDAVKANIQKLGVADKEKIKKNLVATYAKKGDKVQEIKGGGLFISSETYEIDLSLPVLIEDLREECEAEVARILFEN